MAVAFARLDAPTDACVDSRCGAPGAGGPLPWWGDPAPLPISVVVGVLAMESDGGVFKPSGFGFTCSDEAFDIITEIATLLEPIESRTITRGGGGADIGSLMRIRMPGMGINVDGTKYFWYRRTDADTVDKLDPNEVALCVATAYKATNLWFLYDSDEAKPVSADGTSISDTYIQVTDIAIGNFIQESSYTITRIK